jgi:hypothetical protein
MVKPTIGERITARIGGGAGWQLQYHKQEAKNADYYLKQTRMVIEAIKRKHPHDWKKRVGGYDSELAYYRDIKASEAKNIKRWEKLKKVL